MNQIKIQDFLTNPQGIIRESGVKKKIPSLVDLQPIIIYSKNGGKNRKGLTSALDFLGIEYYLNPSIIETPVKGYPIHLDEIRLIY